ncbi:EthD family reductase [Ilumatobacter sp.]|uniref:EthD family reductase n=1 Tax=Ilumatobacter sp. TaxID=1967498 RepID=UPI003AF72BD7
MLAITILYPRTDDFTFDMEYYTSSHMPMFAESVGDACTGWGAATIADGKYAAMGWMVVTDQASFKSAMKEHGAKVMGDVPNYTNVRPETLIGEITGGSQ